MGSFLCKRDNKNLLLINERVKTENTRDNLRRIQFDDECKKLKINPKKIIYLDHHQCHAWSAFSSSPFEKSLVFTLDGRGDLRSGLVALADKKKGLIEKDYLISAFDGFQSTKSAGCALYGAISTRAPATISSRLRPESWP